jgi:signal peptidase I
MDVEFTMTNGKRRLGRKLLSAAVFLAVALALLPAYVRAYTIAGTSAAPTLLLGDWVWVNHSAYDIRLPYSERVLLTRGNPALGELVLVASPDNGYPIFKRIAALPGDRVAMDEHHLSINGIPLTYTPTDNTAFAFVPPENCLGSAFETEVLGVQAHLITYTPGSARSSFPEVPVPPDHYYLLGDNRDESRDSRIWGPVPRQSIRGRLFYQPHRR